MTAANPKIIPQVVQTVTETEDDFGFEMRAGKILQKHANIYEHGGTCPDPVTAKPRQFDFRAKFRTEHNDIIIYATVELKNLP